eukprot:929619-Rhodomonas_salina.1
MAAAGHVSASSLPSPSLSTQYSNDGGNLSRDSCGCPCPLESRMPAVSSSSRPDVCATFLVDNTASGWVTIARISSGPSE